MSIQQRILTFIVRSNWILLIIAALAGHFMSTSGITLGIIAGGLIVTINFHLLYRSLRGALTPPHLGGIRAVLGKYYVRFLVSAIIIFVLVADHYVHPLGLIIGLSVVVTSIFIATFNEIRRVIFKEAA